MLLHFAIVDGRAVVIVVCPEPACRRSVVVRWPARWSHCELCGSRADVPETADTQPV